MFNRTYSQSGADSDISLKISSAGYSIILVSVLFVSLGIVLDLFIFSMTGFTILLSFLYFVILFIRGVPPDLSLSVDMPSTQVKAKQFTTLSLELSSDTLKGVIVELKHSSGIFPVLKPNKSILMRGGQNKTSFVLYTPRRGKERISAMMVSYGGFPGLFYFETEIEVDIEIIVVPQPQRIQLPWTLKQKIFNQFISEIAISRRGRGDEFLSLRDFQFGDEIRNIHWKATAKWGKLISKEFEEPIQLRFLIVVDRSMLMAGPKLEFVLSAILELSSVIRQSSHNCTILVHGDRYTWKHDLGVSPSSLNRLSILLHSIEPEGSNFNFQTLNDYITHHRLQDTVMILLSDLEKDPQHIQEGYTRIINNVQRLIFFACSTPGFTSLGNGTRDDQQLSLEDYYYTYVHLNSKISLEYARREQEYRRILSGKTSKFHLIATYNTNILLELQATLEGFSSTSRATLLEGVL